MTTNLEIKESSMIDQPVSLFPEDNSDHFDLTSADTQVNELNARIDQLSSSAVALENITDVIQSVSDEDEISPMQFELLQGILESIQDRHPEITLDPHSVQGWTAVMEDVDAFSLETVKEIQKSTNDVQGWVSKIVDNLEHSAEQFDKKHFILSHELTKIQDKNEVPEGKFRYRSIIRNLVDKDGKIDRGNLADQLDEFLTKTFQIKRSVGSSEFRSVVRALDSYTQVGDLEKDKKALEEVFFTVGEYLKTILPQRRTNSIFNLEVTAGRYIYLDPKIYLGGKVFYSYAPTDVGGGASTITSGVLRTTIDRIDLKGEIPYLSPKQAEEVLKALAPHIRNFSSAGDLLDVTKRLSYIIENLVNDYRNARSKRKGNYNPRAYVVLMNIAAGLLYGIHVKALNQSSSVINAALKYADKSIRESRKPE